MPIGKSTRTPCEQYTRILSTLEAQLSSLDRAGAHKAAAHLDAAIQQLRRDQLALELASAAKEPTTTRARKTAISAPFMAPSWDEFARSHVVARKAKPANAR